MKGYTTIQIGGEKRPVKFGTNQTREYCKVMDITLHDYYPAMEKWAIQGKYKDDKQKEHYKDVHDVDYAVFVYSGLFAGAKTDRLDVDFDHYDVSDWIDDIDIEELTKVFNTVIESNEGSEDKKGELVADSENGKK